MSKIRILHIIDSLTVGGAEKILVGVINSLTDYDHHLIYLGGSDMLINELPSDCKIVKLNFKSKWDIPACIIRIKKYIRQNNIQIVHSHLVMATLIARIACPSNVKLFSTVHSLVGSRFFGPGKIWQSLIEKITYKKRHHLITVSEEVRRDYNKYIGIKGKSTVLPNYVEDVFFGREYKKSEFHDNFRMVTVGNLKPAKNYKYLLEAFNKLPQNITLDIYGDGPMRNEIQAEIDRNKLNIRLCGIKNNVYELLRDYDMFVMSSSFEGYGIALMEAMACGMPAAISDIPVLRETTGNVGIYFDLADANDFVRKITDIVSHKINLDPYAKHNFELAKAVATKKRYIKSLNQIYTNSEKE